MKNKSNNSLIQSLQSAKLSYKPELNEEQGGFIIKDSHGKYSFVPVRNRNTGQPVAKSLYTADKAEFAKKVLTPCMLSGFELYASFHTHPKGYPAKPSRTDLTELFTGHTVNYIWAPQEDELNQFTYTCDGWDGDYWALETITT